jgi:exonuclease III
MVNDKLLIMKIITWNCNGAFRLKYKEIIEKKADIYIIQECENPKESNHKEYIEWSKNYLWIGDNKNKGLGIFALESIDLKQLDWTNKYQDHEVKYFLPCIINNSFQLIGVWTHYNNSPNFNYIGQFWKYLQIHKNNLKQAIIIGDFNSNSIWDQWDRWWNHSDVVKELNCIGINSLYHKHTKEEHGRELIPTYFQNRKIEKPYHIDYCFASENINMEMDYIEIEKFENWKHISDHTPIIISFK